MAVASPCPPASVEDHVSFGTGPTAIGGIGTDRIAPPFVRGAGAVETGPLPIDPVVLAEAVEQALVEAVPDPSRLPVPQPPPAGYARTAAHLLRKHLPRDASLEDEDVAGQTGAVRDAGSTTLGLGRFGGQQRRDDGPAIVGHKRLAHDPGLPLSTRF